MMVPVVQSAALESAVSQALSAEPPLANQADGAHLSLVQSGSRRDTFVALGWMGVFSMRMLYPLILVATFSTAAIAQQRKDEPVRPPPIVRTNVAPPPIVQTVREAPPPIITPIAPRAGQFGRWSATDFGDYTIARTENESGSVFGMLCGTSCVYFVNFQKDCDAGDKYPAMINGPLGAFPITLSCYHIEKLRVLTFQVEDNAINMLADKGEIGFAIPLGDGKFGVSRFSLQGGLEAVGAAINVITQKRNARQEGLRDFTI